MISSQQIKLAALALALLAISTFAVACSRGSNAQANQQKDAAPAQPAAVDVTTAAAISRQLPRYFEATGSLAADEQTDVAPTVAGKVVAIGVDLGSFVQKGSVLVRLDDRDARIRLEQAQAQVAQALATVRQAEARIGLRTGQNFDPTNVPEVRAARVNLELAEKNLQRHERLIESGDVSRSAYDLQKAQRDQLAQMYEVAVSQARQNYAAVLTARAAMEAAQTQIAQSRKAIADAVVIAPMSGFVSDRPVALGEYVATTNKVATIVRTNPLRMKIDIPEQAIPEVQVGMSISLTVSAFSDRTFNGRVARVSPSVTATSRTLTVEAEVENSSNVLKPGQFATVRILLPQTAPAVLVPARAVRTDSGTSRVFVIKDGRAYERIIQPGQTEGDLIEIKSGVSADELVATSNLEKLSEGMAVRQ
jgi:RND family efflux transporter MFP subunit